MSARHRLWLTNLEARTLPATFTVTNLADRGPGTLRQAVHFANNSTDPLDIVDATGLIGTIKLAIVIAIDGSTEIRGPGPDKLAISGENATNLFDEGSTKAGDLITFTGVALTKATSDSDKGWGTVTPVIAVTRASLTFRNCVVSDNVGDITAVRWQSTGNLMVEDCVFERNSDSNQGSGAAILVDRGQVNIRRTTFRDNESSLGGAVFVLPYDAGSSFTFDECVFIDNSASNKGGAAFVRTWPGTVVQFRNTTFSGNNGIGAALFIHHPEGGNVQLESCTLVSNGTSVAGDPAAGIVTWGPLTSAPLVLNNSLVAANYGRDIILSYKSPGLGTISSNNSLIGAYDPTNVTLVGTGNLSGTLLSPLDPLVALLADNGGPTHTHALLPGSPAINAGMITSLTTDQRGEGFARQIGSATDIGAFEFNPAPPPTTTVSIVGGAAQRSMIKDLTVDFSAPVAFPSGLSAAFTLSRTGPGGPTGNVSLAFIQTGNTVTITFDDPMFAPIGGSLIDGHYSLGLNATKIVGAGGPLDGNANGIPGDHHTVTFHRFFGDSDGNGRVDSVDFAAFRNSFGLPGPTSIFDFNNDGGTDASDFAAFRMRFGLSIVP